jgi:hypothetical protein
VKRRHLRRQCDQGGHVFLFELPSHLHRITAIFLEIRPPPVKVFPS